MVDGIQKGFGPAADIQLFENAVYMRLDGLFTDEERGGDFFVGKPFGKIAYYLHFPFAEDLFGF